MLTRPKFSPLNWLLSVLMLVILLLGVGLLVRDSPPPPESMASALPRSGVDTVAMFVVSSLCGACKTEPYASEVRSWLDSLSSATHQRPTLIGVSVDMDVSAGLQLLQEFGEFDEISVGSGYMNTVALKYIWQGSHPFAGVPQLIVLERVAEVADSPLSVSHFEGTAQRIVGLEAIAAWLQARSRNSQ